MDCLPVMRVMFFCSGFLRQNGCSHRPQHIHRQSCKVDTVDDEQFTKIKHTLWCDAVRRRLSVSSSSDCLGSLQWLFLCYVYASGIFFGMCNFYCLAIAHQKMLSFLSLSCDVKGIGWLCPLVSLGGVLISLTWALCLSVDKPQSLWHVTSALPDLWSPSQPQSFTNFWLVLSYTAWWQRHTGVSNLPKATAQWCQGRTRTRNL